MGFYSSSTVPAQPRVRLFVIMGGCETLPNRAVVWWPLDEGEDVAHGIVHGARVKDNQRNSRQRQYYLTAEYIVHLHSGARTSSDKGT